MAKNIENNKNIQWENIEKEKTNWSRKKWESVKDFLKWRKDAEKIQIEKETGEKSEKLKDVTIDSTLDNLNLDMQEWLELKDSDDKTKEELNQFFEAWKQELKNDIEQPWEAELRDRLFKSKRFGKRSPETVAQIAKSATIIKNEIDNWEKEPNLVAKWLLNIVKHIMWTEK